MLMVAYMDAEALAATVATGEVHFHSRSRGRLWRKGETSGHVLRLRGLALDCDADALLVTVDPRGPTCHRGTRSCFDHDDAPGPDGETAPDGGASPGPGAAPSHDGPAGRDRASDGVPDQGFGWLEMLWATIADRAARRPHGSYTTRLLDGGVDAAARKVTEEATEVLLAAKDDATAQLAGTDRTVTRAALAGEMADLLYHALVLLAERGTPPTEALAVLRERHRS